MIGWAADGDSCGYCHRPGRRLEVVRHMPVMRKYLNAHAIRSVLSRPSTGALEWYRSTPQM
jgi:hypothetical protein